MEGDKGQRHHASCAVQEGEKEVGRRIEPGRAWAEGSETGGRCRRVGRWRGGRWLPWRARIVFIFIATSSRRGAGAGYRGAPAAAAGSAGSGSSVSTSGGSPGAPSTVAC